MTVSEQHILRAHDVLETEVIRTTAERDAFRQFRAQCAQIDPTTPPSQPTATGLIEYRGLLRSRTQHTGPDRALQQVCDAYRETIMAIPHYTAEYNEPLDENLAAEIGDELATAITTGEHFPPQIKHNLAQTTQQCVASRRMLLDDLDREQAVLETVESTITEIHDWLRERNAQPMHKVGLTERYRIHKTLCQYESHCNAVARARQETVHIHRVTARQADSRLFNAYLYGSLGVTYPVLADLATLGSLLREARQSLERTLV